MTQEELCEFANAQVDLTQEEIITPELSELLPSIDALLVVSAKVPRETIDSLHQCRVIARYGVGTDNIDVEAATRRGILVTNVPNFCLSEVADHTMALVLGVARKLMVMDRHTRSGHWQARVQEPVHRLAGKTLGLIGFGAIAQQVARRARAFDLHMKAYDPLLNHTAAEALNVQATGLDDLLQTSDFVSLHVPLTLKTHHMIGESELRRMKPDAILINTARGGVVDENALVRALSEGWIAGAGIDVYESLPMFGGQPGRTDHPLFGQDKVILTPHSAACSVEALADLMREGARQAIAVLTGTWPSHCVNPAAEPRFALSANATQ